MFGPPLAASRQFGTALRVAQVREALQPVTIRQTALLKVLGWISDASDAHLSLPIVSEGCEHVRNVVGSDGTSSSQDGYSAVCAGISTCPHDISQQAQVSEKPDLIESRLVDLVQAVAQCPFPAPCYDVPQDGLTCFIVFFRIWLDGGSRGRG